MTECMMCTKGKLVKKNKRIGFLGTDFGEHEVEVCNNCGEEHYNEKTVQELEDNAKVCGVWGLKAKTNSLSRS